MANIEKNAQIEQLIHRYYTQADGSPISDEAVDDVLLQMNGIKAYANDTFPGLDLLTDEEICVLSLSIWQPNPTPEQAFKANMGPYWETKRALSRFYNLHLLLLGIDGYEDFIANQEQGNPFLPVLDKNSFVTLSEQFQNKSDLSIECLKIATLIGSVPLSNESKKAADSIFGKNNYVVDSVEFPAKMFEDITVAKKVYPLVQSLFDQSPQEQHEKIAFHLQNCFPHGTHYRHQMYTEGNQNMFAIFCDKVRKGQITKEAYADWRDYWTLNITGFRGQVDPKGALYLTQNTYRGMKTLESVLVQVFDDAAMTPDIILNEYLAQRGHYLELNIHKKGREALQPNEQAMLAHIGALLRLYHPREGDLLIAGYKHCQSIVQELAANYFDSSDPTEPTPTYAPAFFANAVTFRLQQYAQKETVLNRIKQHPDSQTIKDAENLIRILAYADAVIACLPIYLAALNAYRIKREAGEISKLQPLSFQKIADIKDITALFGDSPIMEKFNVLDYFKIDVSETGAVTCESLPRCEERLAQLLQQDADHQAIVNPVVPPQPSLVQQFEMQSELAKKEEKHKRSGSLSPNSERKLRKVPSPLS